MQSKQPESERRITARSLAQMATRASSYEEFGRRIFQQLLLQAVRQLEQGPVKELSAENIVTIDDDFRAVVRLVEAKDYSGQYLGLVVCIHVETTLGGVSFCQERDPKDKDKEEVK